MVRIQRITEVLIILSTCSNTAQVLLKFRLQLRNNSQREVGNFFFSHRIHIARKTTTFGVTQFNQQVFNSLLRS